MIEIVSRSVASIAGMKWYFTGKSCKRGHIAERQTVNGSCRYCSSENYDRRRDAINESKRRTYDKDKEREKRNTTTYNERRRAKYAANPEKFRERNKKNYLKTPDIWKNIARNRKALLKKADGKHAQSDVDRIRVSQKDKCAFCKTKLKGLGHIDHIIALSKGGTNWPRNLQLLCVQCNCSKKDKDPIDFARREGRLL